MTIRACSKFQKAKSLDFVAFPIRLTVGMGSEFDAYKDNYQQVVTGSISFIGQGHDFFLQVKADHLVRIAKQKWGDLSSLKILDVGCGVGLVDRLLLPSRAQISGIETSSGSLETAKRENPSVHYQHYDGKHLPFEKEAFDISFAMNVFHHIPKADWKAVCLEMKRVTKPGGMVFIFEHNPVNPLTQLAVKRCEFDRDANLLRAQTVLKLFREAELRSIQREYILFFPWRAQVLRQIEQCLNWLPLGAQYFVVGIK